MGSGIEEGFVVTFQVWVEVKAKRGRSDIQKAEPGEGRGPVGIGEELCQDLGVGG